MPCTENERRAVEREFGEMVETLERIRRNCSYITRRMRDDYGAVGAIRRLVLARRPGRGFYRLVNAGYPQCTVEAIAIRHHPDCFDENVAAKARDRLRRRGHDFDTLPGKCK